MDGLRDFVAGLIERHGAAVEKLEDDRLQVLSPRPLQAALGWPELSQLSFGTKRPDDAIVIGFEGDWISRFGSLLGDHGRWADRQLMLTGAPEPPDDPERILGRGLDLPNAVWRFESLRAACSRLLMLVFRFSAVSDEKREGLFRIGFNLSTGAPLDELIGPMRPWLDSSRWEAPDHATRIEAGWQWAPAVLDARIRGSVGYRIRSELEPFLRATRRRLDRDRNRIHEYHEELHEASRRRLAALPEAGGEKSEAERLREQLRVAAIEREYRAKLDDLRNHYAMRVSVECVQALDLYVPVQRLRVLIRRRKGERRIELDWHCLVRQLEPPPCDWGLGLDHRRIVCDEKLHLTEPAGFAACRSCAKAWCHACHPARCPRCGAAVGYETDLP
jgi:hypothetical protein